MLSSKAPPASKKRKTAPTKLAEPEELSDEEEPEDVSDDEDAVAVPGEEEDEEEDDIEGESGDDAPEVTAKTSGPVAAAKKAKGAVVPKENDLDEVENEDE